MQKIVCNTVNWADFGRFSTMELHNFLLMEDNLIVSFAETCKSHRTMAFHSKSFNF